MKKKEPPKLTPMQEFALAFVKKEKKEVNAGYLATMWAEHKGKPAKAASRDRFGLTSAAYRTLRKLEEMGLIKVNRTGYGSEWYYV